MITQKGFNIFVAALLIVSTKVANGCFSDNYMENVTIKTGSPFFKVCHCVTLGYSVHNIRWIDPHGNTVEPLSTNSLETLNTKSKRSSNESLHVHPLPDLKPMPGTPAKAYTVLDVSGRYVSLHIDKMSQSLSGPYVCETNFEGNKYTQTYNVEARDSLYFVNTNTTQHLILTDDSLIRCEPRGNTDYVVRWSLIKDDSEIQIENDDKYNITDSGLIIRQALKPDVGTYKCTAIDTITGEMLETTITVGMWSMPIISTFDATPNPVIVDENVNYAWVPTDVNTNVTIQCIATGTPDPEYSWKKIRDVEGNPIQEYNVTWQEVANTIVFDEISKEDAGLYICEAKNVIGSFKMRVFIAVRVVPEIVEFNNVTAVEGSMAQIVCKTVGEPVPDVILTYIDKKGLENDTSITYETKPSEDGKDLYVTFNNVSRIYEGVYTCNATNDVGTTAMDIYFTVFYKPFLLEEVETIWGWNGKLINMTCEYDSNPPGNRIWSYHGNNHIMTASQIEMLKFILGQLNNVDSPYFTLTIDRNVLYGLYECTVRNQYGEAKKTVILREAIPPGAIKNVTDVNKTATSITFHIEGPEVADGPPVLGYMAQYDLAEHHNTTSIHQNRSWSLDRKFTLERLKPSSTYVIKFAATNEAGTGVWSDFYEFDTPETSVPEPPSFDESQPGKLRWTSSETNGDPIDHYLIENCPFVGQVANHSLCEKENTTASYFSLDRLDRNRTYSFKIQAHNSHGYSDYTYIELTTPAKLVGTSTLTAGAIIGLSIVVVFLCLLLLDLLLLCWRRQGIIASCYFKKNKKKENKLQSRDKKGLLVTEGDTRPDGTLTQPNNGHREYEYNKTTGIITGKHSSV